MMVKLIGERVFQIESGKSNFCKQAGGQTNKQNYMNFVSSPAIMFFYLHVKIEFDQSKGFGVRVQKPHPDRQTLDTSS